jgi:hypothetical protein
VSTAASPGHLTAPGTWALRLAGLAALVNGAGFGAFDIPAIWHLARDHTVWYAFGNPTYGNGPDRLSGGDPLAHAIVPAAALLGGLMVTAVSLDVRARSRHSPLLSSPPTRTPPACSARRGWSWRSPG